MTKGKRYILVEVDVEEASDKDVFGHAVCLTSDSQQILDSIHEEINRLHYVGDTNVYGTHGVHIAHINDVVLEALHMASCEKDVGALGKPCDKPELHLDGPQPKVLKHQYTSELKDSAPGLTEGVDY